LENIRIEEVSKMENRREFLKKSLARREVWAPRPAEKFFCGNA